MRPTIKEVLEHTWLAKYNKSNLPDIRKKTSKNTVGSLFKMYTTTCDEASISDNKTSD